MAINLKYIASNTSLMMSLSVGYLQILASEYPEHQDIRLVNLPSVSTLRITVSILAALYKDQVEKGQQFNKDTRFH